MSEEWVGISHERERLERMKSGIKECGPHGNYVIRCILSLVQYTGTERELIINLPVYGYNDVGLPVPVTLVLGQPTFRH